MKTYAPAGSRARRGFAALIAVLLSASCVLVATGCAGLFRTEGELSDDGAPLAISGGTVVGDLQVLGGTEGVDYALENVNYQRTAYSGSNKVGNTATPMLVIKTSTPLTIANAPSKATSATGIRIAAGVDAYLTFDGVVIQSDIPCDVVTNAASPGTTTKTLAGSPTKLHLTLADGSANQLSAAAGSHAPGLRCGEGSELYIDDSVPNVDASGNPITPANGFIPAGTVYVGQDGSTYTASGEGADSSLSNLESRTPGKLTVQAGYRAAGIGGGSWENAGKLTFNGGEFTIKPWMQNNDNRYNTNQSAVGTNWDYGCGAGIGGGYAGGGTEMYFNGGTFTVYGSYHGAAIGGGMYAYNTTTPGDWAPRSYPFADAIRSGILPDSTSSEKTKSVPGNITINGGFIKAIGGLHGNAFGQACGGWAKGCTILVTGGTLLPDSYGTLKMIGGDQGYVVITGGSVNCDKSKFGGIGDTAWGVLNGYSNANNKVFMTTIDLSADGWKNHTITNFGLTVDGESFDYGAPSRFDNGKLYLWLPSTAVGKEVRVSLTGEKVATDGTVTQETPADLYIPSVTTDGKAQLKRYIDFKLPEDWRRANWYKDYNGLPFVGYDFETQPPILTDENPPKSLNVGNKVTYKYQYLDEAGEPMGQEIAVDATHPMPVDASKFTITMTSTQYSSDSAFSASYWGHRAHGEAEIRPVASRIATLKAQWYDGSGNLIDDDTHKAKATDKLLITAQITSGTGTAATCKAPTGTLELLVDGKVVETFPLSGVGGTPATGQTQILTYADGREYVQFTYEATAASKDYLLPTFQDDNKHEVTMNYKAAKNYLDCMAEEDPEVPKANVTVEPVDPDPGVTGNDDITVDAGEPEGPENPPLSSDGTTYQKDFDLTYTFKKLEGEDKANKLTFEISSPSSGAVEAVQPDDAAVASDVRVVQKMDAEGNPVKDAAGNFVYEVTLDVTSVGDTVFHLKQQPNGAFYGTDFAIDLTVNPNGDIDPAPQLAKAAENVTHPTGAVQAGDRIKYTITATNAMPGSVWWFPKMTDKLPEAVTLDPATLHLTSHSEGIDKMLEAGEYDFTDGVLTVGAGVLSRVYGPQSAILEFECVVNDELGVRGADFDVEALANEASATGHAGIPLPEPGEPDPKDPDDPETPEAEKPATTPANPEPTGKVAPENMKVLPKDPHLADMNIEKVAENLTRSTGKSQANDEIQYTVTMTNGTPGSCWYRAAFLDALPKGVVFVPGSAELVTPMGDKLTLSDAVYDAATNRLGVAIGDIYGGEQAQLTFRAIVTELAMDQDMGNIAHAVGTLPSQLDKPKPGDDPADGDEPGESEEPGDDDPDNPSSVTGPGSPTDIDWDIPEVPSEPGAPYLPENEVLIGVITEGGLPVNPEDPEGPKNMPKNPDPAYPTPDDNPNGLGVGREPDVNEPGDGNRSGGSTEAPDVLPGPGGDDDGNRSGGSTEAPDVLPGPGGDDDDNGDLLGGDGGNGANGGLPGGDGGNGANGGLPGGNGGADGSGSGNGGPAGNGSAVGNGSGGSNGLAGTGANGGAGSGSNPVVSALGTAGTRILQLAQTGDGLPLLVLVCVAGAGLVTAGVLIARRKSNQADES